MIKIKTSAAKPRRGKRKLGAQQQPQPIARQDSPPLPPDVHRVSTEFADSSSSGKGGLSELEQFDWKLDQEPKQKPVDPKRGVKPLTLPFTVLYDHRERAGGWRFTGLSGDSRERYRPLIVPIKEVHLETADYTIEHTPIYIERKSHDDVIGSIGGGHDRLRAEHERMRRIIARGGHCCVVIESSLDKVIEELESPLSERGLAPAAVMGVVASWPMQFGVPWHWAGSRRLAEDLSLRILRNFYETYWGDLWGTSETESAETAA